MSKKNPKPQRTRWITKIAAMQDPKSYAELNWEGSFEDYLNLVKQNPKVTRTTFQRIYDMILSYGKTEYIDNKRKLIRYHFFSDEKFGGRDAIFGLKVPLMKLVNVFKSTAQGYGTERRVLLLHEPVGSSKSTIARMSNWNRDPSAQEQKKSGLDRAHRGHQLSQDRRNGSDSDLRGFNFDGEFNIANHGIVEFVEVQVVSGGQ